MEIDKLIDLFALNLASNSLTGKILTSMGNVAELKVLNLCLNAFTGQLGKLKGR
jgi:hypothetical protein